MKYTLTSAQLVDFEEQGFLIIRDALSDTNVRKLDTWAKEVHDLPQTQDAPYLQYKEINVKGQKVLCRTENFLQVHEGFNSLFRGDKFLGILSQLSGEDMVVFKEKINYKFAGSGGFAAHIDRAGYGAFKNLKHLSILVAIDPSNMSNGGLEVVAGSHKVDIPLGDDNCIKKEWVDSQNWLPVELNAGDILIFGTSLAHKSGPNKSDSDRRAVYITYNRASEGDGHDAYYKDRALKYPSTHKRVKGKDAEYLAGAKNYAYGTPMLTMEQEVQA